MGFGLKQTTTIDSGVCTFCFNKKGKVQWPDAIQSVLMDTHVYSEPAPGKKT